MIGRFNKIIGLISISIALSSAYASPIGKIRCPQVSSIQQTAYKINKAIKFDESWLAVSTSPLSANGYN